MCESLKLNRSQHLLDLTDVPYLVGLVDLTKSTCFYLKALVSRIFFCFFVGVGCWVVKDAKPPVLYE